MRPDSRKPAPLGGQRTYCAGRACSVTTVDRLTTSLLSGGRLALARNAVLEELVATRGREGEKTGRNDPSTVSMRIREHRPRGWRRAFRRWSSRYQERLHRQAARQRSDRSPWRGKRGPHVARRSHVYAHAHRRGRGAHPPRHPPRRGRAHPEAAVVPAGKRLDFLMQELNREANTLASKSPDRPKYHRHRDGDEGADRADTRAGAEPGVAWPIRLDLATGWG
jgi:hypothetical protein